ncbi:thiamine pyrophosphate-dependent enzyme [Pseudomonas sp. W22_MBD1_FP4]|uniref:thiamine pyrophosphate-dependent enzyme n=1 Tax=Pseudomonas sp. W22_MBD1_FP4 TaxID=3240272 RepID=UPI003F9B329E
MVMVGDGGFRFTVQEPVNASEQRLAMAIILWNNPGQLAHRALQPLGVPTCRAVGALCEHRSRRTVTGVDYLTPLVGHARLSFEFQRLPDAQLNRWIQLVVLARRIVDLTQAAPEDDSGALS